MKKATPKKGKVWRLRLYVAGQSSRSLAALANLKALCEDKLKGRYKIQVIDVTEDPALAVRHQIVALPTLIRELPEPLRRIIGDLSDRHKTLVGLDLL